MKNFFTKIAVTVTVLVPNIALAQTGKTLSDVIWLIVSYLNVILILMMGVAVVFFVFYVIKYFIMADANRAEGGMYVLWSVIGFFVILSFWGLVNILQNTFGIQNENNRPSTWASFTNLFPGSGSNNSGSLNSPSSNAGSLNSPSSNNSGSLFSPPSRNPDF